MSRRSIVHALLFLAFFASASFAHVNLRTPNGGERLEAGGQYLIVWNVHIQHSTIGWNLEYSVGGGAFTPIVMGLPAGDISSGAVHSYLWTVPSLDSTDVRVRVTQDNNGLDYTDTSSQPFSVVSTLAPDVPGISIASGGAQNLAVDFGPSFGGGAYAVLGSLSGTQPGIDLGGPILPLNFDVYLDFTLNSPNTAPLLGSSGALDSLGQAVASFVLPSQSIPPQAAGLVIYHAAVVLDLSGTSLGEVSNPTTLTFLP